MCRARCYLPLPFFPAGSPSPGGLLRLGASWVSVYSWYPLRRESLCPLERYIRGWVPHVLETWTRLREGVALCLLLATAVFPGWIPQSRWIALSCRSMTLGPQCPQVAAGRLFIYVCIGGWGGESNWEIVSFRSCVRTRGLVVEWNFSENERACLSLFPLCAGAFPFSLVNPSASK